MPIQIHYELMYHLFKHSPKLRKIVHNFLSLSDWHTMVELEKLPPTLESGFKFWMVIGKKANFARDDVLVVLNPRFARKSQNEWKMSHFDILRISCFFYSDLEFWFSSIFPMFFFRRGEYKSLEFHVLYFHSFPLTVTRFDLFQYFRRHFSVWLWKSLITVCVS